MGPKLTNSDLDTVLSFAEQGMKVYKVAENMYYSRNTIAYRLQKVKKFTGLDPHNFYDLITLVDMCKHDRNRLLSLELQKED